MNWYIDYYYVLNILFHINIKNIKTNIKNTINRFNIQTILNIKLILITIIIHTILLLYTLYICINN